ncbi:cellulase family glycosylhydrolase [Streptomyces sp. NPDC051976]|uniref:glycoside hydrolase family 5 protein n=1 Tax=Streptomyces sp. NPDC051976 TaxID=3154947 RepID=UPI0034365826
MIFDSFGAAPGRRVGLRALLVTLAAVGLLVGSAPGAPAAPPRTAVTAAQAPAPLTGAQLAASWSGPLSTRGRYIVDAGGNRFKLKAGNWSGAQGTWEGSGDTGDPANNQAGQVSHNIPLGLDRAPLGQILGDFHSLGLNSVRLPFANAMIHDTNAVPDSAVAANPQLKGDTPLQVYDAVVKALTDDGFAVVLNNHTTTYRWCCGLDGNERWNSGQSTQQWEDDWVFLVNRYKNNKRVVGADLRNEVRRDTWDDPNWGSGDAHDEYAAFEDAGNKILRADPDALIIMEGINWQGIPADPGTLFPHGRPMLTPVRTLSNTLIASNKLVYSAHFYAYTGPNFTGAASGAGHTNDWPYEKFPLDQLKQLVDDEALFVTQDGRHFTAPVWISEFGAAGRDETDPLEQTWWTNFTDILVAHDTDFSVWPLVGWADSGGRPQDWALLSYDAGGTRHGLEDPGDWRAADWNKLVNAPGTTGPVARTPRWNMLDLDFGDQNVSQRMLDRPDWSPGNSKGSCPDTERLIGLARGDGRGLCTDSGQPARTSGDYVTVTGWNNTAEGDWASGYDKLQCPDNYFAVGYSEHSAQSTALLCAPAAAPLPTTGHTVWFDRGDNPANAATLHGDWASGHYKGQCADDEYVAGVADTWRNNEWGVPDVLLCRRLS